MRFSEGSSGIRSHRLQAGVRTRREERLRSQKVRARNRELEPLQALAEPLPKPNPLAEWRRSQLRAHYAKTA